MAIQFAFSSKIPGTLTGGQFGLSISRIAGPGPGETGAGAPASVLNTVMIGNPFFFGGSPEYVQNAQAFGSPAAFTGFTHIHAPDSVLGDQFGLGVDLSSGYSLIVGSPNHGTGGEAYVFTLVAGSWAQQQEFTSSDIAAADLFGQQVSIDGDVAAVGAPGKAASAGAVYIFNRVAGVWTQKQKIVPADIAAGDNFGGSLVLLGINLFVAAASQSASRGAVYWYQLVSGVWTLQQKIVGPLAGGVFGSVAFDGSTLLVGASGPAGTTGLAYVYTLTGSLFTLLSTLVGSDSVVGDQFGSDVAVQGGLIAVGARVNGVHGAVYVFQNLAQSQKIVQTDPTGADLFGTAVSIYSGAIAWIVVGASGNAASRGAAYFYLGPDPAVFTAQMAFMGVRRVKGEDPARPTYKFNPKPYIYNAQVVLTKPGLNVAGQTPPFVRLVVQVKDYDFDLYELRLRYRSAAGVFQDPTVPLSKLWIYDPVTQQISNAPILDIYVNGLPLSKYENGAFMPPLLYPRNSAIQIDFLSVVNNAGLLPLTCFVDLVGVQRQPCA